MSLIEYSNTEIKGLAALQVTEEGPTLSLLAFA